MRACTRFVFVSVCCAGAAAVAACSSETPTTPTSSVHISGRTIDWHSGAGVGGVTVELGGVRAVSDATGGYTLTLPATGAYDPIVGGLSSGVCHVSGSTYRGDFLVNAGTCVSRYGVVASARTGRPIAGATVTVGTATTSTAADGWYRVDLGCPSGGQSGFNPGPFTVTKPGYVDNIQLETRGFFGTVRIDVDLVPQQ